MKAGNLKINFAVADDSPVSSDRQSLHGETPDLVNIDQKLLKMIALQNKTLQDRRPDLVAKIEKKNELSIEELEEL